MVVRYFVVLDEFAFLDGGRVVSHVFKILVFVMLDCVSNEERRIQNKKTTITWRCRGSNPGPFTCEANALNKTCC